MAEERDPVQVRGCSVTGCLVAAVAIFVLLLIGLLVIAFFRFSEPPANSVTPGPAVTMIDLR